MNESMKSNNSVYNCDASVLLSVHYYRVFVGEEYLALVPSHLPHLRELCLENCMKVSDKCVKELVVAVPKLKAVNRWGRIVRA